MSSVKLEGLSKYYVTQGSVVRALTNINLEFSIGEFVAITGESGSGKSTLAHILAGILGYEEGELYVDGAPTSHFDRDEWDNYRRDNVSFISQSYGIIPTITVLENVESALRIASVDTSLVHSVAMDILKRVELSELYDKPADKLSSGQKQRLSIARALAKPSKILIADEPTGNLDRENSEIVLRLLKEASSDHLVILITHDFDEASPYVTRRLILADGAVVTDARFVKAESEKIKLKPLNAKKSKAESKILNYYITKIILKSKPVLTVFMCLLLAVTTVMSFVFLGTFIISLDDTHTREYKATHFRNGDPTRIVVMHKDGSPMTEEDYNLLNSIRRVESLERYGYFTDVNYYYRADIDYVTKMVPTYSSYIGDLILKERVEFISNELFASTIPYLDTDVITEGRAPESIYEIVSRDPSHSVGDKVTVYFKDLNNWGYAYSMKLTLEVVGKANGSYGMYFSNELASALNRDPFILLPYSEGQFDITGALEPLSDEVFYFTAGNVYHNLQLGSALTFECPTGEEKLLKFGGFFDTDLPKLLLVSENSFKEITDFSNQNQTSVFIKDYAYTERVINKITDMGYLAISPFKEGSLTVDAQLATERIVSLVVSLVAFLITAILELVLIKVMFSTYIKTYKLLSDIGLTHDVAYRSGRNSVLLFMIIGEAVGILLILLLSLLGVEAFIGIAKYLKFTDALIIYLAHALTTLIAIPIVTKSIRTALYFKRQRFSDINFLELEEVGND